MERKTTYSVKQEEFGLSEDQIFMIKRKLLEKQTEIAKRIESISSLLIKDGFNNCIELIYYNPNDNKFIVIYKDFEEKFKKFIFSDNLERVNDMSIRNIEHFRDEKLNYVYVTLYNRMMESVSYYVQQIEISFIQNDNNNIINILQNIRSDAEAENKLLMDVVETYNNDIRFGRSVSNERVMYVNDLYRLLIANMEDNQQQQSTVRPIELAQNKKEEISDSDSDSNSDSDECENNEESKIENVSSNGMRRIPSITDDLTLYEDYERQSSTADTFNSNGSIEERIGSNNSANQLNSGNKEDIKFHEFSPEFSININIIYPQDGYEDFKCKINFDFTH